MTLIYDDDLNENVKLWRGIVKHIKVLTQKDLKEYNNKAIFISPHYNYVTIKVNHSDRQSAIGVNGRSVAPVANLFHIESGNIYGFFYNRTCDLVVGDDIIFVPQVNVYEPNIILPKIKNYYSLTSTLSS
tara:strand:+ start:59 stop:448 length:390 start_codon:yes stop_codon:yes gene_type:complete